jgi:Domain of unknown function (DUF4173)
MQEQGATASQPSPAGPGDPGPCTPAPPPPRPASAAISLSWPRLEGVPQATGSLIAGSLATGMAFDLWVRSGTNALGAAATVWTLVALVLASGESGNRWAAGCFVGAAGLAAWLVLRASPWLVLPDLAAIGCLVAAGVLLGPEGSPFDLCWSTLCVRALVLLPRLVWVPLWMARPLTALVRRVTGRRRSDVVALARGLAVAVPIAAVLGLLLGSADPVFASFFNAHGGLDPGDALLHLALVACGALLLGAIVAGASSRQAAPAAGRAGWGTREALVVMWVIDVLFGLFAVAQVVAALGGGEAALRDAGVTYSDYARSGFFQLLWVAGLSWIVIVVARNAIPAEPGPQRSALIASIEVAIGLVLLIVYVAHSRLQLYEVAYGFTMLRLYSHVFAGVAAAAFVLLGASVAGLGASRSWLFGAVGAVALAALVGLNAASPEAVVVRLNVQRAEQTGKLDADYAGSLSDDATPLALSPGPGLSPVHRDRLRGAVCAATPPAATGWASYNVAAQAALDARRRACRR